MNSLLIHLRLPFQLLLAPVFLWGWLFAGGGLSWDMVFPFIVIHLFLYGGATAYNSYYDQDEGPIGGLEHPPPVVPTLLPFSLAVEFVGWLLAALVNLPFFIFYGLILAIFTAYSHPRTRWKGRPVASLLAVGLGQGVLAYLAGYTAVHPTFAVLQTPPDLLAALAATLLILGVYPLTQVFQVEADRARGDRTVAVAWGIRRCVMFALSAQAIGGATMAALLYQRFGPADAALIALAVVLGILAWAIWAARFDPQQVIRNYRYVMRRNFLSAAALWLYFGYRLSTG